jgi:hypothetical protein
MELPGAQSCRPKLKSFGPHLSASAIRLRHADPKVAALASWLPHQDARFPALTLDLRDAQGLAADTIIWAENGTGKSSLLSLYFSTFRPSQRLFLGKQAESKVRELGDYLRDRDLGFVITEWDTTDDRAEASLMAAQAPLRLHNSTREPPEPNQKRARCFARPRQSNRAELP